MGLDIYRRRFLKNGNLKSENYIELQECDISLLKNKGFSKFIHDKQEWFYDINKYLTETLVKGSCIDDWVFMQSCEGCINFVVYFNIKEHKKYEFDFTEVCDMYLDNISVLYYEENNGYVRKGMNSQFYNDLENGKIPNIVLSKNDLIFICSKYCYDSEARSKFIQNIIEGFVEGEDFVYFSW